jgi:hypothetical protein
MAFMPSFSLVVALDLGGCLSPFRSCPPIFWPRWAPNVTIAATIVTCKDIEVCSKSADSDEQTQK